MALLILPNRRTAQPQTSLRINRSNPLTQGLDAAYSGGYLEAVSGQAFAKMGTAPTLIAGRDGVAITGAAASSYLRLPIPPRLPATTQKFTALAGMILGGSIGDSAPAISYLNQFDVTIGGYDLAVTADFKARIELGVTSIYPSLKTNTVLTPGVLSHIGGTYDGTNLSVYFNGRMEATTVPGVGPMALTGSPTLDIGANFPGDNNLANILGHQVLYALCWNGRVLTEAEILSVRRNVWQLFEAPARRLLVDVPAGGGVTLAASWQAQATLSTALAVTKPVAVSAGAVATLTPALAVAKPLAVTASGSATFTAALSVAKPLAMAAPAAATLTPALAVAMPLALSAGAVATLTPALTVAMPLSMLAAAVASFTGTLQAAGTVNLAMTAGAVATLTPTATVTKPLAMTAGAVATLTADLSVAKPLAMTAGAVATVTADLTNQGVGSLAMLAGAVATLTPALSVAKPLGMLAGGVAAFSGTIQAGTPLAVSMGAQASLVAALSVSKPLAMSPAAQATLTAALTVVPGAGLAVLMQAQATLSAALSVAMPLSVVMGAQATLGGGLSNVTPGGATVAPTEYDLFVLLGGLFQSLTDVEIIRGQGNRTPVPSALNYIVITPLGSVQKATPVSVYSNTVQNVQISQSREYTVSVDCFGPESNRWATILSMVLKTPWACDSFPEGIDPLYAGDPKQFPLIDGEQQYEDRWRFDAVLHYTPVVTLSQQSAVTLALTLVSVDASYPPGA